MTTPKWIRQVMDEYPGECRPSDVQPLRRHTGISGVQHWRLESPAGTHYLRCWPIHTPLLNHLQYCQAVLWHAVCEGIDFVPLPLETMNHKGVVEFQNRYWELLPWMEGEHLALESRFIPGYPVQSNASPDLPMPDQSQQPQSDSSVSFLHLTQSSQTTPPPWSCHDDCPLNIPSPSGETADGKDGTHPLARCEFHALAMERIAAAMVALAQFHEATSTFPLPNHPHGFSSAVKRHLLAWQTEQGPEQNIVEKSKQIVCPCLPEHRNREIGLRAGEILALFHSLREQITAELETAKTLCVPIQPSIGNAHRRHLLYDREGLSGILDFKEMGADTVALDIAMLLGTLVGNDIKAKDWGLKAYEGIRPLSEPERHLVEILDLSNVLATAFDCLRVLVDAHAHLSREQIETILEEIAWQHHRLVDYRDRRRAA